MQLLKTFKLRVSESLCHPSPVDNHSEEIYDNFQAHGKVERMNTPINCT